MIDWQAAESSSKPAPAMKEGEYWTAVPAILPIVKVSSIKLWGAKETLQTSNFLTKTIENNIKERSEGQQRRVPAWK